jgi:hypothetical protein
MIRKVALIILPFLLFFSQLQAQPWFLLNRQQKDSVIFHHFDKSNTYLGLGLGLDIGSSNFGLSGGTIKLEPTYGYFFRNRQMLAASIMAEKTQATFDTMSWNSLQICTGGHYRYYLPERNVLHPFFGQFSIYGGYFRAQKNWLSDLGDIECFILKINFGIGISISINKYNLELGFSQNINLINQKVLKRYIAGETLGYFGVSYCF